jgi:hypothetical protein
MLPPINVAELPRQELPTLLGQLAELTARIQLRLQQPQTPEPAPRCLNAEEAARIAGVSKRWLLHRTRGLKFRRDLSRKQQRFDEAGLRAWLTTSGRIK